jgi:hypothetical protein
MLASGAASSRVSADLREEVTDAGRPEPTSGATSVTECLTTRTDRAHRSWPEFEEWKRHRYPGSSARHPDQQCAGQSGSPQSMVLCQVRALRRSGRCHIQALAPPVSTTSNAWLESGDWAVRLASLGCGVGPESRVEVMLAIGAIFTAVSTSIRVGTERQNALRIGQAPLFQER